MTMQVVSDLAALRQRSFPGIICGVGVFDGVHLGHQAILRGVVAQPRAGGGTPAVFTFLNHPLTVLAPSRAPRLITPPPLKTRILEEQGIALTIGVSFTPAMAALSPETFIRDVLVGQVGVRGVHVGADFRFGRGREGTPEDLVRLGVALGFTVKVVPEVAVGGTPVHSTLIRELLAQAKLREAQTFLGRPYLVLGAIEVGAGRGKALGFPTANLDGGEVLVPDGIYAGRARAAGEWRKAVMSLGVAPTFGGTRRLLEVHFLPPLTEAIGPGVELTVALLHRIRDEIRFPDAAALVAQMRQDVAFAEGLLAAEDG